MKKILVFSWFFPPINSSEGLVTFKLLKNSKHKFDVFTQKNNNLWSYNSEEHSLTSENVNRIFAKSDNLKSWEKEGLEYYVDNSDKYDVIMTRSMPPESHIIGLKIKKYNDKIKWIASFGDPIANNPYVMMTTSQNSPYSCKNRYKNEMGIRWIVSPKRILKNIIWHLDYGRKQKKELKKEQILQKEIIENADMLIFNSTYQKNYMLKGYSDDIKSKAIILNHSYDKSLYPAVSKKESKKLKFTYIGHLDDIRTPINLFKAINKLYKNDYKLSSKVEFNFYGNMSNNDKLYLLDNDLLDIIKIKKPVDYITSLKIMKESDYLLHIDANLSSVLGENIFFAAKLADYIGSGSKIIGITMLEGISANILRNLNALVLSHSEEEIYNYLYLIINENYNINMNKNNLDFDAKEVAKIFDKEISKYVK